MKRKYFLVTLTDGGTIERDVPTQLIQQNVNLKATDIAMTEIARAICNTGLADVTTLQPRWIAPAYIKYVDVIFE